MKRSTLNMLVWWLVGTSVAFAAPDQFLGDTAIYSAVSQGVPANVLFIIDNSSTMGNPAIGEPYALYDDEGNLNEYEGDFDKWTVYKMEGQANYVAHITNEDETLSAVSCPDANQYLRDFGTYTGGPGEELTNKGECGKSSAGTVFLGNLLNYQNQDPAEGESSLSQVQLVQAALTNVVNAYEGKINFGIMEFGHNNKGGQITFAVQDLSAVTVADDPDTTDDETSTAKDSFYAALDALVSYVQLTPGNSRPLAESLLDAQFYFQKDRISSSTPISHVTVPDSPVEYSCQKNFVVFITNGDTVGDSDPGMCSALPNTGDCDACTGDYDGDENLADQCQSNVYGNGTHLMDDVAKYAYDMDLSSELEDIQRLQTCALLIFSPEKDLLRNAANKGEGLYRVANSANEISQALQDFMNSIVDEDDTAFVAPVVPASPENRTASGNRIYLGFFKPISQKPWWGNLKKFGIDADNNMVDVNGDTATDTNGNFKPSAKSFWSPADATGDGGEVDQGGVGEILKNRAILPSSEGAALHTATNPRKIYTYLGSSVNLTDSSNALDIDNASLSYESHFGLEKATDMYDLIRYVHGLDAYDNDEILGNDEVCHQKRSWIMGDVLHSKPLVLNFNTYNFSTSNEVDAAVNKTYIFVGANDGMLHAFRDRDGVEEWAFVPPSLLPDLQYLTGFSHTYFVDGSPVAYVHDANKDGDIVANDGDAAVLVIGTRRGGGQNTLASGLPLGSYCALDVTDPTAPKFLWQINNLSTDFSELGEPWALPKLAKVKIGTTRTIVAIFGAGYNNNEDLRYGNQQLFPDDTDGDTKIGTLIYDFFSGQSSGSSDQYVSRGRGVFAVEVARLSESNGVFSPDFSHSGEKIWSFTHTQNGDMNYSIPSDVTILDRDRDGFADRLYAGDTGGQMWSCDIGASGVDQWTCTRLFKSNPGNEDSPTTGRKIFYPPTVTYLDSNTTMLYFGTGDRAHPLNYKDAGEDGGATIERFYAIQDRDTDDNPNGSPTVLTEDYIVDVTENELQQSYESSAAEETATQSILNQLYNDQTKYGWMIRLDHNNGEKILATPSVFNGVAFFTSYTPDTEEDLADGDPCEAGNLGTARLYAVDYRTGEAVYNFYTASGTDTYSENQDTANNSRAADSNDDGDSWVLRRADRELAIGSGISPPMVFIINKQGETSAKIFLGKTLVSLDVSDDGMIYPVYWLQK